MRDNQDLMQRAAAAKQHLLLALRRANAAALDGARDQDDLTDLAAAADEVGRARDALDLLRRRLQFHVELARLHDGAVNDESSRGMINLVRLGVDGGYEIGDVRRRIDEALGRSG